jgi:DNA-directed RNA polymerase subunit RPC12/RpoP
MISKRVVVCHACKQKFTAIRMTDDWRNPPTKCSSCNYKGSFRRIEEKLKKNKARYIDRFPGDKK